jgi:protein TonB
MNVAWAARRGDRASYAARGAGVCWSLAHPAELRGTGLPASDRQRLLQDRAARSSAVPIALSVLAHTACVIAFMLAVPGRMAPPDIPDTARVAMVFEPAPVASPASLPPAPPDSSLMVPPAPPLVVPQVVAPPAGPTVVPPQTETSPTAAAASEPPPPPVAQPSAIQAPVPVALPAPALPAPGPLAPAPLAPAPLPPAPAPVRLTRSAPKAVSPSARKPLPQRQAAVRPNSAPANKLASLTPPPSPAEAQSADVAVAHPAAPAPLIPPRPVAGMATNRAPAYPQIALSRGETGRVMLRVSVSSDGRPLEVDVAETSGYPSLDVAAQAAVRRWQFIPATQAGSPVAAIAEVPVRFRLDN